MLQSLVSRFSRPLPGRAHDGLFATFAPEGASAATLHALYHQYDDAFPDEPAPPQNTHFRALVDCITQAGDRPDGLGLMRMRAAYVSCFEKFDAFRSTLERWRHDPEFRDALVAARRAIVADLARAAADMARRKHMSRWRECREATLDIEGETRLTLIQQMRPDDWHKIVRRWNWDHGFAEIDWITSQRACDRATALVAFCSLKPSRFAMRDAPAHERKLAGFVRALAARLESGFYPVADLSLDLNMRTREGYETELAAIRAIGQSPWRLPEGLLDQAGIRPPAPRYTISDGRVQYEYEYWLKHVAP